MNSNSPTRWQMLAVGTSIYFAFGLVSAAIAVMVGPIRAELGITYGQMGVILGSWQFVYIFAALPIGLLLDRVGLQRALFVGAVLIAASAFLRASSPTYAAMLGAVGLFGVGGPVVSIGLPKLVANWFAPGRRTLPTGIYVTGMAIGAAVGLAATDPLVIPLLGDWRAAYVAYGVVASATALWWLFAGQEGPDERPTATAADERAPSWADVTAVLREPRVLLVATVGIAGFMLSHGLNNWLPEILSAKGFALAAAGALATVPRFSGIAAGLAGARLAALVQSPLRACAVALLACSLTLAALSTWSATGVLIVVLAAFGLGSVAIMPLMTAWLMDLPEVGARRIGAAAGLYFAIGEIGGFGGPALVGWLHDLTGSFVPGILAMAVLALVTLVPLWFLARTRAPEPNAP